MAMLPKLTAEEFAHSLAEAELGDEDAEYLIGAAYLNGNGVKRDLFLGEHWLLVDRIKRLVPSRRSESSAHAGFAADSSV